MLDTIDGLVLESKYPQQQYLIKGPLMESWRDGIPMRLPKQIVLQFDRHLLELDDTIREQELTEEDKLYVARQLNYELGRGDFVDFWVHEKPEIKPPWPTYNDTHHNTVAQVAESIGLVNEALWYEQFGRPGGPRESVVAKLNALAGNTETLVADEDELAAV
jgi:hypothetical protein